MRSQLTLERGAERVHRRETGRRRDVDDAHETLDFAQCVQRSPLPRAGERGGEIGERRGAARRGGEQAVRDGRHLVLAPQFQQQAHQIDANRMAGLPVQRIAPDRDGPLVLSQGLAGHARDIGGARMAGNGIQHRLRLAQRLPRPSQPVQRIGAIEPRLVESGLQSERRIIAPQRFPIAAAARQRDAEIVLCAGVLPGQRHRAFENAHRFLGLIRRNQAGAEIGKAGRMLRPCCDRLLQHDNGFVVQTARLQGQPQIDRARRIGRIGGMGGAHRGDRVLHRASGLQRHAAHRQRVGIAAISRQQAVGQRQRPCGIAAAQRRHGIGQYFASHRHVFTIEGICFS